jgi:alpha-beta hydrolase superfamily lysophospholipase
VIVVCPGRIESYVKYAELAYDLVHMGFDVLIIDHGQGLSGRMLRTRTVAMSIASAITSTILPRSGSRKCSPALA